MKTTKVLQKLPQRRFWLMTKSTWVFPYEEVVWLSESLSPRESSYSNAEIAFLIPETNFSVEESRRNLFEFGFDVRGVSSLNETEPEAELILNQLNWRYDTKEMKDEARVSTIYLVFTLGDLPGCSAFFDRWRNEMGKKRIISRHNCHVTERAYIRASSFPAMTSTNK